MFLFSEVGKITGNIIGETSKFVDLHLSRLLKSVKSAKGNARVMILSTPFWAIPFAWLGVYQSLFAKHLGVSDIQLGYIASIGMLFQFGTTLFSGYASDNWGRKKTVMFWDAVCFLGGLLLLLFAQNIWYFAGYIIFLNARFVGFSAFKCLCIEGVKPENRSGIFSLNNLIGALSSLFVIFAGVFVDKYGLDLGTRIIAGFCILGVTGGLYYRQRELVDSCDSRKIVADAKKEKRFNFKKYFFSTFKKILLNKTLFWLLVVQILVSFTFSMWNLYWPIYFTGDKGLGFKLSDLPVFSVVGTLVSVTSTFLAISVLKQNLFKKILVYTSTLPVFAAIIYIFAPPDTMYLLMITIIINNIFGSFYGPITESMTANSMKEKERARVYSVFSTMLYIFCVPSTALAGLLYSYNPRALFAVILFLTIVTVLIMRFKLKYLPLRKKT